MRKIVVAGTGYVGLVAGVCFAEMGNMVTCVDVDQDKINLLRQGISPFSNLDLKSLCKRTRISLLILVTISLPTGKLMQSLSV